MLILASGSIWRRRLLKKHGYKCKVIVSEFNEISKGDVPAMIPLYNAYGKANFVRNSLISTNKKGLTKVGRDLKKFLGNSKSVSVDAKKTWIIGVDTIGVLGKKILLKPKNRADAKRMLLSMSGSTHEVITGLVIMNAKTGFALTAVVKTGVTFKSIEKEELERYLDSNQWVGKAGSYAVQGRAKGFVERIDGDRSNVVGLPIPELKILLKQLHIR